MNRRIFLKSTFAVSTTIMAVAAGLLTPRRILAVWPEEAFTSSDYKRALKLLLGEVSITASPAVKLKAPSVYDSGAQVPVSVTTELEDVETIALLSENNPFPLIARFDITKDVRSAMSTRIKLAGKTNVIAVVGAKDKYYRAAKRVKVTVGGCA